jgi:hypothetical protein
VGIDNHRSYDPALLENGAAGGVRVPPGVAATVDARKAGHRDAMRQAALATMDFPMSILTRTRTICQRRG